ncbi:MAG: ECF transporter S component [Ruminococcaceae bacterium]|nr:ECF transporter S component [Oscillospiraceae bacterium]
MQKKIQVKTMVLMAMLAAVAYLLSFFKTPLMPAAPFLSYEPMDVAITVSGFLLGPLAALIISLLAAAIEALTIGDTGIIGFLMNVLSSAAFACTAAFVYKKKRSVIGAIAGLVLGSAGMIVMMLLWNWLITPLYMGTPREAVEGMLIPIFLPFNALKAGLNSALTLLLYKPLVSALRKTGLIPKSSTEQKKTKWGIYLLGVVLLAACILLLLVCQGKL